MFGQVEHVLCNHIWTSSLRVSLGLVVPVLFYYICVFFYHLGNSEPNVLYYICIGGAQVSILYLY